MRRLLPAVLAGLVLLVALATLAPAAGAAVTLQVVDSELDDPGNAARYRALAPIDVDSDGRPDIAVSGQTRDGDYRYSRPTSDGVPNLDGPIASPGVGGRDLAQLDGMASAVVGGEPYLVQFDPDLTVLSLYGLDSGTFSRHDQIALGANVQSAAIGDADLDGVPDVAVLLASGAVSVIRGESQLGLVTLDDAAPVSLGTVAGTPVALRWADVAGSALADVAVLTSGANPQLHVATATGSAPIAFSSFNGTAVPANPRDLELADFDGDGRRDVLLGTGAGVSIARNETGSGGQVVGATSTRLFNDVSDVAAGDFDGDGTLEVAAAWSALGVGLMDVVGTSPSEAQIFDTVNGANVLTTADLEGDGADEVVIVGISVDVLTNVSPGLVGVAPSSANLGSVEVGRTGAPVTITLTNQREGTERVRSVHVEGTHAFDVLVSDACPGALTPGDGCSLTARLSPSAAEIRTAQIRVDFAHAPDAVIPVSGTGTAAVPGPSGPAGPAGPAGTPGTSGTSGRAVIARAAVLTTARCRRSRGTRVRCSLRLAAPTDVGGRVRLLARRRQIGRATLRARARSLTVLGKVARTQRSVVLELALPGMAAQRMTVRL